MPILQVTALPQPVAIDVSAASAALALAVSVELGEELSGTWVTWQTLAAGTYIEGDTRGPEQQPRATHPPIVRVLAFQGRPPEVVARVLSAVAETIVRELDLEPGNAFVVWDELQAGQVHSGGVMPGV